MTGSYQLTVHVVKGQEIDMDLLARDEVASLIKTFARELPQPLFISVPEQQWLATCMHPAHLPTMESSIQ